MNKIFKKIIWCLLVIFTTFLLCCKKHATQINPLIYTDSMAGVHTWTGTQFESNLLISDTTFNITLTATIIVINDTTISFFWFITI